MIAVVARGRMWATSLLGLLLLCSTAHADGSPAALTVVVVPVEKTQVTRRITAMGSVVAWREIPIATEAAGIAVTEVAVDEGDRVAQGQVLARLNHDRISAEMLKQKAAIGELEASLASASSDAARARSVSSGVISAQAIEQRETLVKTTRARLQAAQAQLLEIEARFRQMVIVAPASGLISSRAVTIGQVVQSGTEMFRLIQDARIEVDARVLESDLSAAAAGQAATIFGPTGRPEPGVVRIISPIVDPKTRLGTVRISLAASSDLKPGMFARVDIALVDSAVALTVPLKALVWQDAQARVFKLGPDNQVSLADIRIGGRTTDSVEILSGLDAGDRVVTEGAGLLNDGDVVHVVLASVKRGAVR